MTSWLRSASGTVRRLDVRSWAADASAEELQVLGDVAGPALDIGCGPGRLVTALGQRGVPTLGIDVAPRALHLARRRGGSVIDRSVFDRVPAEGRWRSVLLFDGNIGIGGDPVALLSRVARLLGPDGVAVVEVEGPGIGVEREAVVLECDGQRTPWFPWAWVGIDAVVGLAAASGLVVCSCRPVGDRWFARLRRRSVVRDG